MDFYNIPDWILGMCSGLLIGYFLCWNQQTLQAYYLKGINKKLDLILDSMNLQYEDELMIRAKKMVQNGALIDAIKAIRKETGLGLKEAKGLAEGLKEK